MLVALKLKVRYKYSDTAHWGTWTFRALTAAVGRDGSHELIVLFVHSLGWT